MSSGWICEGDLAIVRQYAAGHLTRAEAAAQLRIGSNTLTDWMEREGLTRVLPERGPDAKRRRRDHCACGAIKQARSRQCAACGHSAAGRLTRQRYQQQKQVEG